MDRNTGSQARKLTAKEKIAEQIAYAEMSREERMIYDAKKRFDAAADVGAARVSVQQDFVDNVNKVIETATPNIGSIGDIEGRRSKI